MKLCTINLYFKIHVISENNVLSLYCLSFVILKRSDMVTLKTCNHHRNSISVLIACMMNSCGIDKLHNS